MGKFTPAPAGTFWNSETFRCVNGLANTCLLYTSKGYLSIRETSYKWGVSERRVNQYVTDGRIPGVERFGRSWAVSYTHPFPLRYRLIEEGSCYTREADGFYRNSRVYRRCFERESGRELPRELILVNHSKVMYDPSLIPPEQLAGEGTPCR